SKTITFGFLKTSNFINKLFLLYESCLFDAKNNQATILDYGTQHKTPHASRSSKSPREYKNNLGKELHTKNVCGSVIRL
ncbi:MAG: hypothetical protein VXW15_02485, partial [Bdellovibrionota bacterium]|nr:hypothetical protein [Bdellovibrionota bacterium]